MFTRAFVVQQLSILVFCAVLYGQQKPAPSAAPATSAPPAVLEFPVILQENLESGKIAVGAKVEAKLTVATLVNRVVIPKDAVFSGVVMESVAQSAKHPSRLAIRMDSVQWKDGSTSIKAYLIPWYYPKTIANGPNLQYGPPQSAAATWNGEGQYPNTDSRVYQPFPDGSDKSAGAIPDTTSSRTANTAARMKDVALAPTTDGGIALVCEHANLKLDKLTTYVLAAAGQ